MKLFIVKNRLDPLKMNSTLGQGGEETLRETFGRRFQETEVIYVDNGRILHSVSLILSRLKREGGGEKVILYYGYNKILLLLLAISRIFCRDHFFVVVEFAFDAEPGFLKKSLLKSILDRAGTIGVCSGYEIDRYSAMLDLPRERFRHWPAPIEPEFFSRGKAQSAGYVFSGGKSFRDYATLVNAARLCPEKRFVIVSDRKSMAGVTDLPSNVEVRIDLNRDDYFELLSGAYLVVVPLQDVKRSSGNQVVYQAMAMGKPVIATDIPTSRDIIRDRVDGRLVAHADQVRMAEAIRELFRDQALYGRLAENGRRRSRAYSMDNYVRNIADALCQ